MDGSYVYLHFEMAILLLDTSLQFDSTQDLHDKQMEIDICSFEQEIG